MNRGQINRTIVNGPVGDPVVRIRIDGYGVARVRTMSRVLAYVKVAALPAAIQAAIGGRVEARLVTAATAASAIRGVIGRADVRALLKATGRVVVHVTMPPVKGRAAVKAKAQATIKAHTHARPKVSSLGIAKFKAQTVTNVRTIVASTGHAKGHADGTIYVRRWLRSPVDGVAEAFTISTSRVHARLFALSQAVAKGTVDSLVMRRGPVRGTGVAVIVIDPDVHKRLPFDEPAPDLRVFIVPAAQFDFVVTE